VAPTAWHELGATLKAIADPFYVALGAAPVAVEAWRGFAVAWGRVADYYAPAISATPWPQAIAATLVIALPLLPAYQAREAQRRAAARTVGERTAVKRDELAATTSPNGGATA
jgi:hypothetical protein